jgi:hypothetical protein
MGLLLSEMAFCIAACTTIDQIRRNDLGRTRHRVTLKLSPLPIIPLLAEVTIRPVCTSVLFVEVIKSLIFI